MLIDKLEDLVRKARPVQLTEKVRVDKNDVLDILDQMRATLPKELKQAHYIIQQQAAAEAQGEAGHVVEDPTQGERESLGRGGLAEQRDGPTEPTVESPALASRRRIRGWRHPRQRAS